MRYRFLYWMLMNVFIWLTVGAGTIFEVAGAANLAVFGTWCFFILYGTGMILCAVSKDYKRALAAAIGSPYMPTWVNILVDSIVLVAMIWFGWWVTSVAWFLHIFFYMSIFHQISEYQ